FFDKRTFSVQYVVTDPETKKCAIIDPVLDFDEKSGCTATNNADALLAYVEENGLELEWILDTHPHADHFSAGSYLHARTGAPARNRRESRGGPEPLKSHRQRPEPEDDRTPVDQAVGGGRAIFHRHPPREGPFSPGHTLASITYVIGDAAFIHDTIFMPD